MESKKEEHDALQKLNEKDLWCQDLDAFVAEWELQKREESDYQKTIRNTNRRVSRKIGAGKNVGKARVKHDEEYNPKPLKANINKGIIKVDNKPHQRFLTMFEKKSKPKATGLGLGGASEEEGLSGMSDDDFAALKADKPADKETSRAQSKQPANGRAKRAAAAAPKKWVIDDDDESESDDGKFLGDVGDMVKGIGGADQLDTTATNGRVSLFAMSHPGSSHGRSTSSDLPKIKSKSSKTFDLTGEEDETNYEMLAKSSPHKAPPAVKNDLDSYLSDEDDDLPVTKKPSVKVPAKRGPKPKSAAISRKVPEPSQPKSHLSPAAKAYAAKQHKIKLSANIFSDDDDDEIVMNDSPPPRPAAKIAAAKPKAKPAPKKKIISDDEDEAVKDDSESPPPQPAARGRGRPPRAAAAVVQAKKPVYIYSEDDELDEDQDESAVFEDSD